MKKFFVCLLLASQSLSAQHLFQKTYGNLLDDWFWRMELVNDTDIYIAGYTRENLPSHHTLLLNRLDSNGNIKWTKSVRTGESPAAYSILQLSNNTLVTTGDNWYCSPVCIPSILLVNIDSSGSIQWKRNWRNMNSGGAHLKKSIESIDHFIVSAGYIEYYQVPIDGGAKLTKSDLNGNLIWNRTYIFNYSALGWDIKERNNGNYLISGSTSPTSNSFDYDMLLMETDTAGNVLWAKGLGGSDQEGSAYLTKTNDNGILLATTSDSYSVQPGYADILAIRLDSLGNVIWSKVYGNAGNEYLSGIIADSSGNYILYGTCGSFYPAFKGTGFAMKIDDNGDVVWSRLYGTNPTAYFFDGKQIHDQLIFCGQTKSPLSPANIDGYLVRTDWSGESGCNDTSVALTYQDISINIYNLSQIDTSELFIDTLSTSVPQLSIATNILCDSIVYINELTTELIVVSICPNPNNGKFIIKLPIHEYFESLEMFNVLGEKVFSLKNINAYETTVDVAHLQTGIYFLRLKNNGKVFSEKFIIRR